MSAARIVVYDPKIHKNDRTDWARVDALTDADIARAVAGDPDAAPLLTPAQLRRALWVIPVGKQAISMRLDEDILRWFKAQGPRYQTRINAVLRAYMIGEKASRTRRRKPAAKKRGRK
jgi:uncharacterized protein (DUF4415 family)